MGFLTGKKLLITGVLSNRSIAYGVAKACHQQGAELAFSYVGERFKDRITDFAAEFDSKLIFDCDVGDDAQIERMIADLTQTWPKFDGFVHSIGFAPREAIAGDFLEGLGAAPRRARPAARRAGFLGCRHAGRRAQPPGCAGPRLSAPDRQGIECADRRNSTVPGPGSAIQ